MNFDDFTFVYTKQERKRKNQQVMAVFVENIFVCHHFGMFEPLLSYFLRTVAQTDDHEAKMKKFLHKLSRANDTQRLRNHINVWQMISIRFFLLFPFRSQFWEFEKFSSLTLDEKRKTLKAENEDIKVDF
jgi:hypothetical protein